MRKILIALILTALIIAAFSGCNTSNTESDTAKESEPVLETNGNQSTEKIALSMQMGHYAITEPMMNFFVNENILNWYWQYGGYLDYFGLDFSKSLKEQKYNEDSTWFDYFYKQNESKVMLYLAYANAAYDRGIMLDDQDYKNIDEVIKTLNSTIEMYGLTYSDFYGTDVDNDVIKKSYEIIMLAQKYTDVVSKEIELEISSNDDILYQYVEDHREEYGEELNTALTRDLGYVISSDRAIIEKVISDFTNSEIKSASVLSELGGAISESLPDNSNIEIGCAYNEKVIPGMFEPNFSAMEDWLKTAENNTLSGVIEITPTTVSGTTYYAVIFFENHNIEVWKVNAINDVINQRLVHWYQGEDGNGGIKASNPFTVDQKIMDGLFVTKVPHYIEQSGKK